MCPFQKTEQWEALAAHYPALHDELGRLAREWAWPEHPGDSNLRRFEAYWAPETGIPRTGEDLEPAEPAPEPAAARGRSRGRRRRSA